MLVLGITYSKGAHDTAAAMISDGRIIAAVEQERLSRIKHDGAFPLDAIAYCLSEAGVTMRDIDMLALGDRPHARGSDSEICQLPGWYVDQLIGAGILRPRARLHRAAVSALGRAGLRANFGMSQGTRAGLNKLREEFGVLPPLSTHGHHASHAAAVFYSSGWDEAAVITVDGQGQFDATVIWHATTDGIRRIWAQPFPNSLGSYYSALTEHLGLGKFAEGKAMGLASYGDPERFASHLRQILEATNNDDIYRFHNFDHLAAALPKRSAEQSALADPFPDFAAAGQRQLETILENIIHHAMRLTGCRRVCLAGGVALNCSANGALKAKQIADDIWVFPASGDAGLAIGAAFLAGGPSFNGQQLDDAYFGPTSIDAEITQALRELHDCSTERSMDIAGTVARELERGAVVGWFQGRTEFGPRALGNRSILADPRTTAMRDRVNRIKHRELWRPLAPVVLAERSAEFFELSGESPFMLFAVPVKEHQRSRVPAIVHVDGSARPQTVRANQNQRLHALLSEFEKLTGIPMLINTSFNRGPEPIVCTAADAVRTFMQSKLDVLVLEDWIVRRQTATDGVGKVSVAANAGRAST